MLRNIILSINILDLFWSSYVVIQFKPFFSIKNNILAVSIFDFLFLWNTYVTIQIIVYFRVRNIILPINILINFVHWSSIVIIQLLIVFFLMIMDIIIIVLPINIFNFVYWIVNRIIFKRIIT